MPDRSRRTDLLNFGRAAIVTVLALGFSAAPGQAQNFPTPDRGGNERDAVTGLLCFDASCNVVRHPTANCICTKQNPAEMQLGRLRLDCQGKEGGRWVQCPVPLPFHHR
ncbi:MAG: hypothetical protein K5872_08200 [Rhizobiaceae bacterium]|nr:hypothetical protein [Rhizobiaceae bacterium]MCV0406195.1 hypothetical protein [Rhizobiaceae bacterium]